MRRSEKEITDFTDMETILTSGRFCALAMVDQGKPYVLPLTYGYRNRALYIHSAVAGKKIDVLKANPQVGFTVVGRAEIVPDEIACKWGYRYRSVVGYGRAVFLDKPDEKRDALAVIMRQHTPTAATFSDKALSAVAVIRIDIESMTGKQS